MVHELNRKMQKMAIKFMRLSNPKQQSTETERHCVKICSKLITKPESILLLSPISQKRYIKSENGEIFIIIDNYVITMVNHQYSYNITVNDRAHRLISESFDAEVEKRRLEMETEMTSNVKDSLSEILKHI
jgi:hypothetical protein